MFINDGDPLRKPHSNCLFDTISSWAWSSFPRSLSTSGMCPKSQFLYPKRTFVKVTEWGKRVKVPRPAKYTKNNVIFSNRYIHIPRTSKYPEKLLNYENYVVNYLFYGDLEGLGYICVFCLEKNMPLKAF